MVCFVANSYAQTQEYTIYTVVGDTDTFAVKPDGTYFPGECNEVVTVTEATSSDSTVLGVYKNYMRFIPPKNGVWHGTATFYWYKTAGFTNEECRDILVSVNITAYGVQDSTVKIRYELNDVEMRAQKPLGQWDGYFMIRLDNNIASPTTFKNFRLRHTIPGVQVEIINGTKTITSYTAKAFERQKLLLAHLFLSGSPLTDQVYFNGSLELDAVSNDTTRILQSALQVTIYPFSATSVSDSTQTERTSIDLFPNPSTGLVTAVDLSGNITHLSISNILGEKLLDVGNINASKYTLDLSKFPAGTYIARFVTSSGVVSKKIIRE